MQSTFVKIKSVVLNYFGFVALTCKVDLIRGWLLNELLGVDLATLSGSGLSLRLLCKRPKFELNRADVVCNKEPSKLGLFRSFKSFEGLFFLALIFNCFV
jgi:hypothetical protein